MVGLWNFLRGYVIIKVVGRFPERFLNLCSRAGLLLWNIEKSDGCFTASMRRKDAGKIRKFVRRTGCKVRFGERKGLPFLAAKVFKHKLFLVGSILCLLILIGLNLFIWQVNIHSEQTFDQTRLAAVLSKNGIRPGVFGFGLDLEQCRRNVLKDYPEISYIYLRQSGMIVDITVSLARPAPKVIPTNVACDVVAKRNGVIVEVYSKVGDKRVRAGDLVVKGQLLISGTMESAIEGDPQKLVHAMGLVKAETWYDGIQKVGAQLPITEENIELAANQLKEKLEKSIDTLAVIQRTEYEIFDKKNDGKYVKVTIYCEEDIGLQKELNPNVDTGR